MTLVEVYISCIIINKVRNIFELVGTVLNLGEKMKIYPQVLIQFGYFTLLFCRRRQRNRQK